MGIQVVNKQIAILLQQKIKQYKNKYLHFLKQDHRKAYLGAVYGEKD